VVGGAPAAPVAAGGEFVDRAGSHHRWEVNAAHALLWEGKTYVPTGVILYEGAAPSAERLDLLAAHGIKDVFVVRSRGWMGVGADRDQALVDALEARGFRYGIALDARPERPLAGFQVAPTRIEVPAEWRRPGRPLRWNVELPGARSALYVLVDVEGDSVLAAGRVPVAEGQARIEVPLRPGRRLFSPGPARLLVVPERELEGDPEERPTDFWNAWQDTQQALVRRLAAVKWGPGLRFFARPAASNFGLRGEAEELVPSSGSFRLQFESWLERRYSVGDLNSQWALNDRQVTSLAGAARLVPFWSHEEGGDTSGWLLDPVTNEWYRADLRRCGFWRDFAQFRADSIRRANSRTATLLKKAAADVPVVWEWTEYHPIFTNLEEAGGLDGLGFVALGRGREAAVRSAAYAYAQADESARPTWFLQLGQRAVGEGEPASAEELRLDWNWLREIGCKGFFADAVSAASGSEAGGGSAGAAAAPDLAAAPERLDWIREYGEKLAAGDAVAAYRPSILPFPSGALGMSLTDRLENGVWWLPSLAAGQWLSLGEGIRGYWIERLPSLSPSGGRGGAVVLWSPAGRTKATFVLPTDLPVSVYDTMGRTLKQTSRRGQLQVALGPMPTLIAGLPLQSVFPVETAAQALQEFEALVKRAEAEKMEVAAFRLALNQAKTVFTPAAAATAYQLIRTPLGVLRAALTPYVWLEGEAAVAHNWSGVQADPRASSGSFLHLDRSRLPAGGVYQARYAFTLEREAKYDLWLAGSLPGSKESCPFTWRLDDRTPALATADDAARRYAPGLGWTRLGQAQLAPGRHVLTIATTESAPSGGYHMAIDALVLAREAFQPNGVQRPESRSASEPSPVSRGAR
jgi:hypothetical protein